MEKENNESGIMFVHKYPDWVCEIVYKDGRVVFFDGSEDLFKYYFNIEKYHSSLLSEDIGAVYEAEYFNLEPISAADAHFVIGSDVHGPMGRELIPLATGEDAMTFMKDHKGKAILRFHEVTPKIIEGLD